MAISTHLCSRLLAAGLLAVLCHHGRLAAATQEPVPVKREILALYDGAQEGSAELSRIHRFAELPLNHLGFIVRFRDIGSGLPSPAEMDRYRGVLTWFAGPLANGDAYLAWANQVSRRNVRYAILGDIGVVPDSANLLAMNRLLSTFGIRHTGDIIAPTLGTRIAYRDPDLVGFECRVDPVMPDYPVLAPTGVGTRAGLMLETPPSDGSRSTVLVALGGRGGYAAFGYEFCHQRPPLYQGRWLLNPFVFFAAAFDANGEPAPDTTTVSGSRLFLGVLDNEGWIRPSKIKDARDNSLTAGEVVLRDLVESFTGLSTTVELREAGAANFGRSGRQAQILLERLRASSNVDLPRRRLRATLSRFDAEYPSISNLAPLWATGSDQPINMPISDDSYFIKEGPVGQNGFVTLKETILNTEVPRRLKPFTVSYHAYVGEYPATLRSVQELLREANSGALTPVSMDGYAAIVEGFLHARIDRIGSAAWRISNRGGLQTIRFDAAEDRDVDLELSVGVLGQKRVGTTLYVALDQAIEEAIVALRPSGPTATNDRSMALIESRWRIRHLAKGPCGASFEAHGYGSGSFIWSGAVPGQYTINVTRAGQEIWQQAVEADRAGNLTFIVPVSAVNGVEIRMSCAKTVRASEQ
ncbi:hypothetical protein JQ607_18175 [Bradyrhizobium liaoningense]|uniref:hypothetical protein n=1 Tax=Bradyrhizobium liaoningense TaxID=43992 RepID=UPI001BACC769|nr:hypothetical protein [Bradyrhizobium liaoningense]MBR0842130.1 hypothetical protein [Bradyrhizobium liaoningense]